MKTCIDCKYETAHVYQPRCWECSKRFAGMTLHTVDANGQTLCLCGCGKYAQCMYLHRNCYSREDQRRKRGRQPSLLDACPLWYAPGIALNRPRVPTPYDGAELAAVVPDDLFLRDLLQALRDVQRLPLVGDGMST